MIFFFFGALFSLFHVFNTKTNPIYSLNWHCNEYEYEYTYTHICQLAELDPDTLREMKRDNATLVQATNNATDAITELVSFMKNKLGKEEKVITKHFKVPDDLDYI